MNSDRKSKAIRKKTLSVKHKRTLLYRVPITMPISWSIHKNNIVVNKLLIMLDGVHRLEEQLHLVQPIQDSDRDVDSVTPMDVQ